LTCALQISHKRSFKNTQARFYMKIFKTTLKEAF